VIKTYYNLAKPGIIYGNAITAIAGFFLASKWHIDWRLFGAMLVGISLVMAAGCVLNNIADRKIDERMERTKNRALAMGRVTIFNAIVYATVLALVGFLLLYFFTNLSATLIALVGLIFYVAIYTPLKPRSVYATLVGSIAGAVPPVVGYLAVTNKFDLGAILLFVVLVAWQMPHFYSIAIYRLNDYAAAAIPVLPVKKGTQTTKVYILIYIVIYIIMSALLTFFSYTGYIYLTVVGLLGILWLGFAVKGFQAHNDDPVWARKMFRFSLMVLLVFSVMVSIAK
jgi:protoheme IX farnesyltransferase